MTVSDEDLTVVIDRELRASFLAWVADQRGAISEQPDHRGRSVMYVARSVDAAAALWNRTP